MGSYLRKRTTTGLGCMKKKIKKQLDASPSTRALFDSVFNQMVETSKAHGYIMAKLEELRMQNNTLREQIKTLQGDKGVLAK